MRKDQKAEKIDQIAAHLGEAQAVYAVDYRGLSVPQAAELRASLREHDATFRVVKNTLTLRAADKAGMEPLKELVAEGPTALTFVRGDAALAAKVLDTFSRQANVLQFKGGLMDGHALEADDIRQLARLPSREVLVAQFAGVVASPITGLVRGLGSLIGGLAVALGQIQSQRADEAPRQEAPAQEPATEEPAAEESPADEGTPAEEPTVAEPTAEEPAAEAQEDSGSDSDSQDAEKEAQ
jgi:large subunit ribosomal protein L10